VNGYGWVIDSWSIRSFSPDLRPKYSYLEQVEYCRIHTSLDESEFELKPPVGAYINDYDNDQQFVALTDGGKHLIQPGEYTGDNLDELVPKDFSVWNATMCVAGISLLFLVVGTTVFLVTMGVRRGKSRPYAGLSPK
jgi:hypothetical protein